MTRPDKIRLAWLLPLALLLSLWWLFRLNPCIDSDFRSEYRRWFPAPPAMHSTTVDPDAALIENPYGIEICDYWPTVTDHWITFLTLLFIAVLIGFLAARFEQHPVRRAALVMLGGLGPIVLLSDLVYLPEIMSTAKYDGYGYALLEVGIGVAVLAFAAALSSLSAWLRVRRAH